MIYELNTKQKQLVKLILDNTNKQDNYKITIDKVVELLKESGQVVRSKLSTKNIKAIFQYHTKQEVGSKGQAYIDLKQNVNIDDVINSLQDNNNNNNNNNN